VWEYKFRRSVGERKLEVGRGRENEKSGVEKEK